MQQTVLITGASFGIGRAIATAFAAKGCSLAITCCHSPKELTTLSDKLRREHDIDILTSVGDIGDYEYARQLFAEIASRFGGLDILINNAGVSHIGLLHDMDIAEWNHMINTNLTSVFSTCKLAIPHMLHKKQGKIINISSVWGSQGASMEVAYSASKGGMNAFTKALAKELAPSNIQVNAIACGVIDTRMNGCFTEEERQALIEEIPTGRFGAPEEVATLALQLSFGHPYLTGQIITLDGGWT